MKNSRIGLRLAPKQRQQIEKAVEQGKFSNISDFTRKAIDLFLEVKT